MSHRLICDGLCVDGEDTFSTLCFCNFLLSLYRLPYVMCVINTHPIPGWAYSPHSWMGNLECTHRKQNKNRVCSEIQASVLTPVWASGTHAIGAINYMFPTIQWYKLITWNDRLGLTSLFITFELRVGFKQNWQSIPLTASKSIICLDGRLGPGLGPCFSICKSTSFDLMICFFHLIQ